MLFRSKKEWFIEVVTDDPDNKFGQTVNRVFNKKTDVLSKRRAKQDHEQKKQLNQERYEDATSWERKVEYKIKSWGFYSFDRDFSEAVMPYACGLVTLNPLASFVNSSMTIFTGSDIFENKADEIDYALATMDILTFGMGSKAKLPAKLAKANDVAGYTISVLGAAKTTHSTIKTREENKINEKNKQIK